MVYVEELAEIIQVRNIPGRRIFIRKGYIGNNGETKTSNNNTGNTATIQLIFMHGTCGSEEQYHPLLHALDSIIESYNNNNNLCVSFLMFDSIGCGRSPIPEHSTWTDYSNVEIQKDFQYIIEKYANLSIHNTIFIGHSYGPSIVLPLIGNDTNLNKFIKGYIFIGTSVRNKYLIQKDGGHPIMKLPIFILKCIQHTMTEAFIKMAIHPNSSKELKDNVRIASNNNNIIIAKSYHQQMKWATEHDLVLAISNNNLPVLIIHGSNDQIIPIECGQHLYNNCCCLKNNNNNNDNTKFVIIDQTSHLVMLEKPNNVGKEIYTFIQKNFT